MPANYASGERIIPPLRREYIQFIHGIDRVIIVRETWFSRNFCREILPKNCFVERNANDVRNYVNTHYPFITQLHKGEFETYLKNEITNHIGKLVIINIPVPSETPNNYGTGSGTSEDLQKLENKSQNIETMTKIDRVVLLLTLTFKKMGKNILDSFSMSDLYIIAAILVVWAASQFFGVGEVIDAALLAWLWWQIGWDSWYFIKTIISAVATAISANSIQQIDDAATELAPAAAALGLDAVLGFILHKFGKGSSVEKAAKTEIKTEEDLVKHDFEIKPKLPKEITTVNQDYLKEMAQNGVKFSPDDILRVEKLSDGRIVFLEKGNSSAGLQHIIERHGADFSKIGVSEEKIPDVIMDAIKGNPVGYQGKGVGRPIYETIIGGQRQCIAITTGSNGFIVGANPAGSIK